MRNLAIVTSTRAEYGLLSPLIKELRKKEGPDFVVSLIVTGTHLSKEFGYTINEIANEKDRIDFRIPISVSSETSIDISKNQAEALVKFTELFSQRCFYAVVLLGDRYETIAIAIAAGNTHTPIFHLCGGDITEGATDEWIRHSITKMSYLHFVTNEDSRRRVIQLGEDPKRVFNYGSTSIDNIKAIATLSKEEVLSIIGLPVCRFAICTFHPVTMETDFVSKQLHEIISAVKQFPNIVFIFTKSNADQGGQLVNSILEEASKSVQNLRLYASLGSRNYLSFMKYSEFVLGNSSSGIIEAPALHVSTVNIGDRQRGRLQAESVLNCGPKKEEIVACIRKAISKEHRAVCVKVISPYGDGHAAEKISNEIYKSVFSGMIDLKKSFFDLK